MFNNNLLAYKDTILHELAHHITDVLYDNVPSHGKEWKDICRILECDDKSAKKLSDYDIIWSQQKNNGYFKSFLL